MNRNKPLMIKIIWILVSINIIALIVVAFVFLIEASGKHIDSMESGWMIILASLCILVILLGIIPMRISQSSFSLGVSLFFAALPSAIAIGVLLNNRLPSFKKQQSYAEIYYKDNTQRAIAATIENNQLGPLKELIKGQNVNIHGNKVWDWPGLNYLQFAVRLRNSNLYKLDDTLNIAAIKILIAAGADPTSVLPEAVTCLPPGIISLLLDAGANPNTHGYADGEFLLFSTMGTAKQQNDIAILLIKKGAKVDARNSYDQTPLMFSAQNAGASEQWSDVWRVERYLLEQANADYSYTRPDGTNLETIIRGIRKEAAEKNIAMPENFTAVVSFLTKHGVNTEP